MAFEVRALGVQAYTSLPNGGGSFTLWHYFANHAKDSIAEVMAPDYFALAADMLDVGNRIMVQATDGGADLYVAENAGGTVRVVEMSRAVA